jgi:DNA-binding transcriptional MerR regulator
MVRPSPASENPLLQIGELSRRSGLPVKTLRYYEEIGLIQAVNRSQGGFRQFSPGCLDRLSFIKEAKAIGLTLAQIGQILSIYDRGHLPCPLVEQTLTDKLREIDQRIVSLHRLRNRLEILLGPGDRRPPQVNTIICPIIQQSSS